MIKQKPVRDDITGWLAEPAALFTEHLAASFPSLTSQPAFEIGVYLGKYLSVIHDAISSRIVGYDLFAHGPLHLSKVEKQFDQLYGSKRRVKFFAVDSSTLTPERIKQDIGANCAGIISIDGSHEREFVIKDVHLANKMLSDDGFTAFDDFLNPNCLGVNEAFYRVMLDRSLEPVDLAPFAYVTNKLFMCRRDHHQKYFQAAEDFILANLQLPWMKKIQLQQEKGIATTYDLVGYKMVRVNS